jgi:hypothetical protein
VRSAKEECLSKLVLFGEASLRRALTAFIDHYHQERNHQGKDSLLLFPSPYLKQVREAQSVVASGSVAYSSITAMPHELFDQTGFHPVSYSTIMEGAGNFPMSERSSLLASPLGQVQSFTIFTGSNRSAQERQRN